MVDQLFNEENETPNEGNSGSGCLKYIVSVIVFVLISASIRACVRSQNHNRRQFGILERESISSPMETVKSSEILRDKGLLALNPKTNQ